MPKGKPWTPQQESQLRQLIGTGETATDIAPKLDRTTHAIYEKAKRLGLKVIINKPKRKLITSTEIEIPKELPTIEETLKILAGALKTASKAGLEKLEIQRLHAIATLASTYKELLADYINYQGIEAKLVQMEEKYAKLAKKAKNDAPKPDNAKMVQPSI